MTKPKIVTLHNFNKEIADIQHHPFVQIIYDHKKSPVFCGDSHCDGGCNFPKGVITLKDRQLKLNSSMVAYGSVFSPFTGPWNGNKIEMTEEYREYFLSMFWT